MERTHGQQEERREWKGHVQREMSGCEELRDRLSRGCSGPTMCSTSPSPALVFLAWFPEEMRPRAAASPPLPAGPEEEEAQQPGRHWSLQEGECPVTARPPQPGLSLSCQSQEGFGTREGEALQGGLHFTPLCKLCACAGTKAPKFLWDEETEGWTGLGVTWCSGRGPCHSRGWNWSILKVSSHQNHSMILQRLNQTHSLC